MVGARLQYAPPFPFYFMCMSGGTYGLFIEKVVVYGTLDVKYEMTSFMTIESNLK